jgi:hypothetical protein
MATATAKWSEWIVLAARLDAGEPVGPGDKLRADAIGLLNRPSEGPSPNARAGKDAQVKVLAAVKRASPPRPPCPRPETDPSETSAEWIALAVRLDAGEAPAEVAVEARALLRRPARLTLKASKAAVRVLKDMVEEPAKRAFLRALGQSRMG